MHRSRIGRQIEELDSEWSSISLHASAQEETRAAEEAEAEDAVRSECGGRGCGNAGVRKAIEAGGLRSEV